ncbi:MAG: hypothetical protein WBG48_13440 [Pricia sp.]
MELKAGTKLLIQKRLKFIRSEILKHDWKEEEIGLMYGKLGAAVFLFVMSPLDKNSVSQKDAERLLIEVFTKTKGKILGYGFFHGLSGIAFGFNYLIQEGFVDGKVNEVLEPVDNTIYNTIAHSTDIPVGLENGILGYLAYLLPRITDGSLLLNKEKDYIFKRLLIVLVNRLADAIEEQKLNTKEPIAFHITWDLPICLILLSSIVKLDLYSYKVEKILNHLSTTVLSLYPRLQSNRLILLVAMKYVLQEMNMKGWKEHSNVLKKGIDLEYILYDELKDKGINLANGTAGIYWLINQYNIFENETTFKFNADDLIKRILQSSYWEEDFVINQQSLLHGLPGIGIMLAHLKNKGNKSFSSRLVNGSLL